MKTIVLLASALAIYFILGHETPVPESVTKTGPAPLHASPREAAPVASSALKRPFERTHEALTAARVRSGAGEF